MPLHLARDIARPLNRYMTQGRHGPSGGFLPTDIANLVLWLDASDASTITLNGADVSQWDDKSGQGNHATQSESTDQPLYNLAAVNGLNVVEFDGVSETMGNDAGPAIASQPETQVITWSMESGATSATRRIIAGANNVLIGPYQETYRSFTGAFIEGSTITLERVLISSLVQDGGGAELFEDGVSQGTTALNTTTGTGYELASRAATDFVHGFCCEVCIYSAALSTEDRETVESYLKRWIA